MSDEIVRLGHVAVVVLVVAVGGGVLFCDPWWLPLAFIGSLAVVAVTLIPGLFCVFSYIEDGRLDWWNA